MKLELHRDYNQDWPASPSRRKPEPMTSPRYEKLVSPKSFGYEPKSSKHSFSSLVRNRALSCIGLVALFSLLHFVLIRNSQTDTEQIPGELVVPQLQVALLEDQRITQKDLVITTFFNHRQDPQRKTKNTTQVDIGDYTKAWRDSILREPLLHGVVLTNVAPSQDLLRELSDKFQNRVLYVNIDLTENKYEEPLRTLSTNDFCVFAAREYLFENRASIKFALVTDGGDVTLNGNPFPAFAAVSKAALPSPSGIPQLMVQSETGTMTGKWGWIKKVQKRCGFSGSNQTMAGLRISDLRLDGSRTFYSSGLLLGAVDDVVTFLDLMLEFFSLAKPLSNCNMIAANFISQLMYKEQVLSGYPWHTRFKKNQKDSTAFIKHK